MHTTVGDDNLIPEEEKKKKNNNVINWSWAIWLIKININHLKCHEILVEP